MNYSQLMQYYGKDGITPEKLEELISVSNVISEAIPNLSLEQWLLLGKLFNASFQMGRESVFSESLMRLWSTETKKRWNDKED